MGCGVHLRKTLNQSENNQWFTNRLFRVTASVFLDFSKNPLPFIKNFWSMSKVPDTPAIKWGRENEQNAILDLEKELNGSITNTGLFVSRICPYIGASPDGIFQDSLIEIKCPFILKDVLPTDLRFLSKEQRSNFCCEQTLN